MATFSDGSAIFKVDPNPRSHGRKESKNSAVLAFERDRVQPTAPSQLQRRTQPCGVNRECASAKATDVPGTVPGESVI